MMEFFIRKKGQVVTKEYILNNIWGLDSLRRIRMFKKLRFKLTLTNVIVVSIIFFIFILGIYFVMEKITYDQTNQMFNVISSDANLGSPSEKQEHNHHEEGLYRYFYVKVNASGNIISTSQGLDVKNKGIYDIVYLTLTSHKNKGSIKIKNEPYKFQKHTLQNGAGTSIIFVNTHPEGEMLETLFAVLVVAVFFGLVLAFFGSLYMANRSLIPIKESWNRQKDFVADASHELRTPLSVIETTIDLLINRKNESIESQMKWLENIQAENKRMTKLVNDMLFLARADSNQLQLEMKIFSLNSALLEVYIPFEILALKQGIFLHAFEGPEIDFYGDEAKIKQLIVILIDNAIKYTPLNGQISMTLKDIGANVEIIVSDTGVGIEKEHFNEIFQRFYRIDKARSRKEGSVGLGLSIADWIVKEHGGTIKVESTESVGTTFHVILPKVKIN